jgi:hypothetical protein
MSKVLHAEQYMREAISMALRAPNAQEQPSQRSHAVSQTVKDITERMLRMELARAIQDLGPQKAAQVVVNVFRLKGLPKELRRHL